MRNPKLGVIFLITITSFLILFLSGCGGNNPTAAGGGITTMIGGTAKTALNLTGFVSSFTGTASTSMATGTADGASSAALFNKPTGITTDGTNLYITDTSNNTIRKIVITTGVVTTMAGASGTTGFADGTGTAATFNGPTAITTDGTNLYVADTGNNTIRKIVISTGIVSTLAGTTGVTGSVDGTGTAALFYSINGIITDGTNIYVVDTNNTGAGPSTIRKIVISTRVVSTLAGSSASAGAVDGIGTAATFKQSFGITTDGTNLYVTDTGNNKIRKIVIATGVVSSLTGIASTTVTAGAADGASNTASFWNPVGITTDGTNLYVAEQSNNKIRKIVISTGIVSSLTGMPNTAVTAGAVDGTSTTASFWTPTGITTDGTNLYVTDQNNNKIRKIQ